MFITFTKSGLISCISIIVATQIVKYVLNKVKVNTLWIRYLPLIILVISYIVDAILLKTLGIDAIASSLGLTAISCYSYDVIKATIQLIKSIFHKEKYYGN